MPDLNFSITKAEPVPYAASPMLNFELNIADAESEQTLIHSVALRCQIRIEPVRRKYEPAEKEKLSDLFGEPSRWGQTLRTMLWTNTTLMVPEFRGKTTIQFPVPCTYDFNIATTKFFHALEDGQVPLCFLFSGTIFYAAGGESFQVMQIPWEKEASFRLPVPVWKQMMEMYYPNSAWLCLRKDAFNALNDFKMRRGLPTWEAAIEKLLAESDEQVPT
jgi:hypothetical protein